MNPSPIRFILFIFLSLLSKVALPQCNTPVITSISNIFYNNVQVNYTCCMSGTYYLEYGNTGFTPGTGASPGIGGTVIQGSANPGSQVISSLWFNSVYDVYVRVECIAGGWTTNSIVKTFQTAVPCSWAQQISCGTDYSVVLPLGTGAWNNYFCSVPGALGREKLYSYTATVTGNHFFYTGISSGNTNRVNFRYRIDNLPCNENNWICLTTASPNNPSTLQFGPLIAGETYYFLADAEKDTVIPDSVSFRIECPLNCPAPTAFNVSSTSVGEININYNGGLCNFEFGPIGYTPGVSYLPGSGGTMYTVNNGYVISGSGSGLIPGAVYHGYLRSVCQQGNLLYYSQNVGPYYFYVQNCPIPWSYNPSAGPTLLVFNMSNTVQNSYYSGLCIWGNSYGEDTRFQFLCPKTGNYKANFDTWPYYNFSFGIKPFNSNCIGSAYNCPQVNWGTGGTPHSAPLGILLKDSIYDVVIDIWDSTETYISFWLECESPSNLTTSNVSPFGFDLNWSCNCADTVFIEIGPDGFTPGTGYVPGIGGTLILSSGSSYSFNNLTPFTKYDVYLRTSCGTYFTSNKKVSVFTPKNCQQAPNLVCGDNVNHYFNSTWSYTPIGPWNVQSCNGGNLGAEEFIFRFTPAQTGIYKILVYQLTTGWTGYAFTVKYFYKHDSLGCNADNWTCIGEISSTLSLFTPKEFLFGPLTAGETYYIMTDGVGWGYHSHAFDALLLCQGVCSGPNLSAVYPVHPNGGVVYASCSSCFSSGIIEIGPQGFTPGTDSLPGINGTVYQNVTFPFNITGLNTGTTYDVYARSNCFADTTGFTTGFSSNFGPLSFTLCSTSPDSINTSTSGTIVCSGDSITLYRNGGIPAPGTIYRWYENGCGFGNFLGTGDSIIVTPVNSTTYYLRAEAPCGNTSCASKYIQVNNSVPVITGNTQLCPGDTSVLGTQISYSQYLWNTGDTTATINVTANGFYGVTVTNSNGCEVYGTAQVVTIPFTPPQISGNLELCGNDSSTLFAGSGYGSYLWSTGSSASFITVADSGVYSIIVSNQFGCIGSDSVMVTVHQPPQVNISAVGNLSFCLGDSVLMVADTGLTGWQWYRNGSLIQGATNPQYWIKTSGNYCCIGSDIYECSDTSNVLIAYTPCIIIGSPQQKLDDAPPFDAQILTDPSNEFSILRIHCPVTNPVDIKVFDSLGKRVTVSAEQIHYGDYSLHLSVPSGLYFVQIHCGNEVRNLKLLK